MNKAMLRSQSSSHNANTALKQINTRFEELERIHLTFLRKYQKDNSKILEHENEISQELYDVILKNQNQIQSNLRQVTRLSESHKQDIHNLTSLLNQQEKEKSRSRDRSQGNDPLQSALEGNLDQLKKNINNALEIEQLERRTTIKIDLGFQQALQGVKSIVSKFSTSSALSNMESFASSKTFSNSIKKSNILSISALQNSFEILKKELNLTVQEVDKWAISFNQESGFLHESFQQLKTHIASLINEVNNPSESKSSSLTHSGSKEKNSGLSRIRRNLPVIEDILTQCATMDNRKNKIFKELRQQFDKRNNLALQCLEQVPEQLNALRLNQENISTEAFRSSESKRIPSPSPYTMTSGRSASTTKERPPSEGKRSSLPQKSAFLSSAEKPKIPKVSSLLASRSVQNFDKSMFEQRRSLYDLNKDKQSRTLTFGRNESLQISQFGQSIGEGYENSQERERDLVSFSTLRTYIQNLITSSDKLTRFLPRITSQENRALELYRNDKQVLENSLNRVNEKDIGMTPRDSIQPVSSRKYSPDVRASSVDAGKDRRNREQYNKLKEMESSKRQVVDEDLEEILEVNQNKKIKDVKDSLKDSYKIYNDLIKGIEKSKSPERDSAPKAQEKNKYKPRGESSGPIGRPVGESDKFKNSIVHLKSLKSDLDHLKVKYEALKSKQLVERREERPSVTQAVAVDRLERRERSIEADQKNVVGEAMEKLRAENEKLEKTVARLRKKADDRKKTLRQLFELMTEKEKELNVYKYTIGAGNSEKHLNKVKEMVEAKRAELEVDFEKIKKKLGHREEELWQLEEKVSKLKKNIAMGNKKESTGGFEIPTQEDEKEEVVIMNVPVKPNKKKSEAGDSAKKTKEEGMRKDLRKHLMGSEEKKKKKPSAVAVTRGRNEKKEIKIETEEAEIDLSPNKAQELKGIMQILKDEKEKLVDEMRNLEDAIMTQRINSEEQKLSERQPTSVESLKDEAEFREAIYERDEIISQLNQENKALVDRYNQISEDMQLSQDHRKKMEKSYQDAINLLDEKVNGLNEYIEELETRNNARNKELTPEKRDRTPSPKRSMTPLKQEYRHLKEVNSQLKDEREQILNKTQEIFSCLGIEGEEVKDLNACTKMDKVLQLLRTATVGETQESKESLELPKASSKPTEAKETEASWNQKETKNDFRRDFEEWRGEKSKGKGRIPSSADNADTFRAVTESKTEEFIERVYNALQKYGIIKGEFALEQREKSDVDAFIKRIEENLMIYSKFQQDFVERYHEVEEEAKFMKQEVNKQEAKYQEKSKEIEKNKSEWKQKMDQLQELLRSKEVELKDVKEQLGSIDADRQQKYSQIEGLRKSNEILSREKEELLHQRQEGGVNMEEMEETLRILEEAKDKEISNLQKMISQKDIDHKGLKDEIVRLKSIVEAHEQELEDVREVNAAKAQICESLQKELNALTTQAKLSQGNVDVQVATLQKELERVKTEKNQASDINHKLNTQISNLEGRLNDLSQNVKEKDSLISENNKQLKALKDSVTEREGRLEEIKARIIQCNTIYEEEKQVREKSDERIKELERELEESRENILEIEGQNKTKLDKLAKEKGAVEASLAEVKKEVQNVEKKEKDLRGELKKSQEEKGALEGQVSEKEKANEKLTGEVNKLKAEIGENAEKNEKLKKELDETQRDLNKLLGEKEAFLAERSLMDEKSTENVKSISTKISQYEENLQNANGKIQNLQEEIENLKKEEQALRKQVEEKEKEVESLQGSQEEVKKLNKEKEANEARFNQRVGELLAGWNEADEKSAQLTEQVRVLTENVDRLEQEKNEQTTSIAKFENKVKAQEKELEDLRKTKEGLSSDSAGAKQEIQGLQSKADDLVDEKRKIGEELNEVKLRNERLEESVKNLEENNKQDIESFQAKIDNLLNEKNLAESELEQKEHKLEEARKSLEKNKRELQGKIDEVLNERNKLADELNETKLRNEKLEETIKENTENSQRLASELATLQGKNEQENQNFQARLDELQEQNLKLTLELNQAQEQNQKLEESIQSLEGQNQQGIQGLQEEKVKFTSELTTLQEKNKQAIETFQQENGRLVSELDNLNEMNHKLEESTRKLQQEKNKLASELDDVRQVERALKDKIELFESEILATKAALQVSQEDNHKATEESSIKIERLEAEQSHLNSLVQEGEKEKSKNHTHITHLETAQEALENNNKLLEKEKEELKKHLEEVKNAKDELVTRIDELEKEKNMIRLNAQEDVGREKEEIQKYIAQLETEKEGLRTSLKTAEKAQEESSQAIEELEHERNLLKGQIKGLDLEIEDAKKNIANLEALLAEGEKAKEGLALRVEELERKNKETEEKLEGLAQERNVIQEKIQKEEKVDNQNMNKIEELQEVIESIRQEVEIKDEEIGRLTQELDELENEKITLNAQVEDLKDQLGLSENTRDLKAKIDDLNERLKAAEKERDEAKKQVSELEQEVGEIKSLLQKVESSRDSDFEAIQRQEGGIIDESTHEVKERLSLIEKERDTERQRIEALLAEKEKLELNIRKTEQEKIDAQRYVERLDEESEDLRRRNEELLKSLDIMSHEASQVKEASSRLSEYEQDAFKLGDKFEQTRYELETMKKEEKKFKEQLDVKVREIEDLNKQLVDLRREKEQLKKDYEKRLAQIRGKKGGDQALYADYEEKINKLTSDNQGLTETNHSLQDQNEDIKRMMVILQEQIINMTEGRQQTLSTERTNNEIMEGLQRGLGQIANHHYLGDGIHVDFRFENRKQVDDCVNLIVTKLNEKQYETPAFAAVSEGGFEKERDALHKEIGDLKSDFVKRLQRVVDRIQRSLEEAVGDLPSSMRAEVEEANTLEQMEKVIENYLEGLRVAYLTNQSKAESGGQQEVTTSERISKIVKENETLRGQNRVLQDELNHIKEELRFKEEEITDLSFKFKSDGENREGTDFRWNSMKDLDDQKVKSLLEDNDGKSVGAVKKSEGDSSDNASKNEIKQIYEKLRKLQDEYDKLDSEHKQLQADYDMVKFLNEDLKLELQDRDSNETERINQQLSVLKEEIARLTAENQQSDITHEKQHIRTMFDKFFKSALEGNKDAVDLLKLLLSLLGYTEGGKNELMASYKAKATGKKSVFGKLF